jgi:hypothetical protein
MTEPNQVDENVVSQQDTPGAQRWTADGTMGLLYELLLDHVTPATLEELVRGLEEDRAVRGRDTTLANQHLASYAAELAGRLFNLKFDYWVRP